MTTSTIDATISERGNGFPGKGDYVPGDDGSLYLVVSTNGRIQTGNRSGASNYIHATVELADWSDCEEGEEFPAMVVLPAGEEV
jgi:hypothetical protein